MYRRLRKDVFVVLPTLPFYKLDRSIVCLIRIIEVVRIEVGIGLNKIGILIIITVRIYYYKLNIIIFIVSTAITIENI